MPPPALPPQTSYTSFYCEENIYFLCRSFLEKDFASQEWNISSVFISNPNKTVALWKQKKARTPSSVVVWDYHVILLLLPRGSENEQKSWIYDFDTTLPIPCPSQEYLDKTFPLDIQEEYKSSFRLVPGSVFISNFASDRSHMFDGNEFSQPPPEHPPIIGPVAANRGIQTNLMSSFVCMERNDGTFGEVVGLEEFKKIVA